MTVENVGPVGSSWFRRLYGLSGAIPFIPAFGLNIPVSAAVSAVLLPTRRRSSRPPWFAGTIALAFVCVIAVAASGLINDVSIASATVGHVVVFVLSLVAYRIALTNTQQASQLTAWFYLAMTVYFVLFGPENTQERGIQGLWKYGIGFPITFVLVYMVVRRAAHPGRAVVVLVLLGTLGTLLNSRASGLICFAAAAVIIARAMAGRRHGIRTVLLAVAGLVALAWALPEALATGLFGQDAAIRTTSQIENKSSPLLGGRTEPPLAIAAISLRPLLGWGDIQSLDNEAFASGVQLAQSLGMGAQSNYMPLWVRRNGNVSLHSIFFGSWVEGGLAAAIFPASLIALLVIAGVLARGQFAPLVTVVCFQGAWSVLFSPWTGNRGVQLAVATIVAMLALREHAIQRRNLNTPRNPERPRRAVGRY